MCCNRITRVSSNDMILIWQKWSCRHVNVMRLATHDNCVCVDTCVHIYVNHVVLNINLILHLILALYTTENIWKKSKVLLTCIATTYPLGVAMSAILQCFLSSAPSFQKEGIFLFHTSRWFYFRRCIYVYSKTCFQVSSKKLILWPLWKWFYFKCWLNIV